MANLAADQFAAGQFVDAVATGEQVEAEFGDAAEPSIHDVVANSMEILASARSELTSRGRQAT